MAKIIFQGSEQNAHTPRHRTATGFISDREILKKRSQRYINVVSAIDTTTLTATGGMDDLMNAIQEEFGTANTANLPIGIVAKCFLGHPHEVHTLDLCAAQIIQHYKIGEALPNNLEKARTLAKHHAYAFVEVYHDKMILIREDGTASKL